MSDTINRPPDDLDQSAQPGQDLPADGLDQQMVDLTEVEDSKLEQKGRSLSQAQLVRRRFFAHKPAVISLIVLVFCTVIAFSSLGFLGIPGWWDKGYRETGPILDGGVPTMFRDGAILGEHPFGQDNLGRDYFALTMQGMKQSLTIAFMVGVVSTGIGVLVGAMAGYFRGWIETILMRLTDLVIVVPLLVFAAIAGQMVQGNIVLLGFALGCFTWTGLARLVRAEVLSLREKEYVSAAVAMGSSPSRIILKHMLPNSVGVIIVNATFSIAAAVLLESSLSYLGLGVQAPETSLGLLITTYENASGTRPWLFWFPGIFIIIIALTVNFIGDGLRDAYDPRQQRVGDRRPSLLTALGLRGFSQRHKARIGGAGEAPGGPGSSTTAPSVTDPTAATRRSRRKK